MEEKMRLKTVLLSGIIIMLFLISCGGGEDAKKPEPAPQQEQPQATNPLDNKGIGPIKQITLPETIDQKMADAGKKIYHEKCTSCHKEYEKYIGPAPLGIFERRSPEWIMNMILNPEEMIQKDPIAKDLIKQFASPMANQHLTEAEARSVLEYFRTLKQ
jgi:mono/diheme cytochrome c family protein